MTEEFVNYKPEKFLDYELPAGASEKIANAQSVLPEKPVRIIELTRKFGLDVWTASFPQRYAGSIRIVPSTGKHTVYLNKADPKPRQRFTCAHELAHYLLHYKDIGSGIGSDLSDNVLFRSHLSNKKEVEANKLAADILMPMLVMNKMTEGGKNDIPSLTTIFGVSRSAILVRLGIPD